MPWPAHMLIAPLALTLPLLAPPKQHLSFKNNLIPGIQTQHRISRTIERTSKRGKKKETLIHNQLGRFVQCNIAEQTPGNVTVYQMLADQPARVVAVFRDQEKVSPTPSEELFDLPKGSTRLHSVTRTPRDSPVQTPLVDAPQQAVLFALLDVAHWPQGRIDAGHQWHRAVAGEGFEGTQTFEFVDLGRENGEVLARLTVLVKGKFTGAMQQDFQFGKGQAVLYWSRLDRTIKKMEAQADYRRSRDGRSEKYKLKLNVDLLRIDELDADAQETVKIQLTAFADGLKRLRKKDLRGAARVCDEFRARWPRSTWLPAIAQLEKDIAAASRSTDRLSTTQLKQVLVRSIITYEAARTNDEFDLLERTTRALRQLADEYRAKLARLARDQDDGVRSRAVFAISFGSKSEDRHTVERAARDKSAKVRALALAGLAAQRRPDVSVDLLLARLGDKEAAVRRRACQAVGACVPREHFSIVQVVEKLDHLMIDDDNAGVRREAVRALAAVGGPPDVPRLEKALKHELDQSIRKEIDSAIQKLRQSNE